jgi:hypothetical protein
MPHEGEINAVLLRQLDAPLRMLAETIEGCPDDLWVKAEGHAPVWQHVLHTVYYVQKWIRTPEMPFDPPAYADFAAVDLTAPAEPALGRDNLAAYLRDVAEASRRLIEAADLDLLLCEGEINGGIRTLMDVAIGQVGHVRYHLGCISAILARDRGEPLPYIGTAAVRPAGTVS